MTFLGKLNQALKKCRLPVSIPTTNVSFVKRESDALTNIRIYGYATL